MRFEPAISEAVMALRKCQCTPLALTIKVGWARHLAPSCLRNTHTTTRSTSYTLVYICSRPCGPEMFRRQHKHFTWLFCHFTTLYQVLTLCNVRLGMIVLLLMTN
jgi:hypothetical protein